MIPPTLAAHLGPGPIPSEPRELVRRAFALLDRVVQHPEGRRELAKDLLAADAFVTYAFELQAELDVEGLQALAEYVSNETERHGKRETGTIWTEGHGKRETGNVDEERHGKRETGKVGEERHGKRETGNGEERGGAA